MLIAQSAEVALDCTGSSTNGDSTTCESLVARYAYGALWECHHVFEKQNNLFVARIVDRSVHLLGIRYLLSRTIKEVIKENASNASSLLPGWKVEIVITPFLEMMICFRTVLITCSLPEGMELPGIFLKEVGGSQIAASSIPYA